jgi:hypothetical protein
MPMSSGYVSDAEKFIAEVLRQNPQIGEQMKKNRATWWDKPQDLETWKERAEADVPAPAYVYFPLPRAEKDDDDDSGKRLSTPSRPA